MSELKEEWRIAKSEDGTTFHFSRLYDGKLNETYRHVSKAEAVVWATAIIMGYEPPSNLKKQDNLKEFYEKEKFAS